MKKAELREVRTLLCSVVVLVCFVFKLIGFAHTLTGSLKPSLELKTHQQHRKTILT